MRIYRSAKEDWSGVSPRSTFHARAICVPRLKNLDLNLSNRQLDDPSYPFADPCRGPDWATVSLPILNPSLAIEGRRTFGPGLDERRDRWHNIAVSYDREVDVGRPGRLGVLEHRPAIA